MPETAGDDAPPPDNAYSPSEDELTDMVDEVTSDLPTGAPDEDDTPTAAASEPESEEPPEPEQTAEGQEAEGEPEEEGAEPTTEPAPAAEAARAAEGPKGKPFKFKASGGEHSFVGVEELDDGSLRVSKEATPQFRGVLASYVELQRTSKEERRNLQRQLSAATKQRSDKDIEADHVIKLFKDVEKMSPEERWVWAEEFGAKAPELNLAIDRAKLERDREQLQRDREGPELSEEEQTERLQTTVSQELTATFERLFADPVAKHLTEDDKKALREKWGKKALKLVVRAEKDDPITGAKKGQLIFDDQDVVDDLLYVAELRKSTGKTVTAAQRNAKMNSDQGRRQPPPTIRGGKPPAPGGKKKDVKTDKKHWKKEFVAGNLDTPGDDS